MYLLCFVTRSKAKGMKLNSLVIQSYQTLFWKLQEKNQNCINLYALSLLKLINAPIDVR